MDHVALAKAPYTQSEFLALRVRAFQCLRPLENPARSLLRQDAFYCLIVTDDREDPLEILSFYQSALMVCPYGRRTTFARPLVVDYCSGTARIQFDETLVVAAVSHSDRLFLNLVQINTSRADRREIRSPTLWLRGAEMGIGVVATGRVGSIQALTTIDQIRMDFCPENMANLHESLRNNHSSKITRLDMELTLKAEVVNVFDRSLSWRSLLGPISRELEELIPTMNMAKCVIVERAVLGHGFPKQVRLRQGDGPSAAPSGSSGTGSSASYNSGSLFVALAWQRDACAIFVHPQRLTQYIRTWPQRILSGVQWRMGTKGRNSRDSGGRNPIDLSTVAPEAAILMDPEIPSRQLFLIICHEEGRGEASSGHTRSGNAQGNKTLVSLLEDQAQGEKRSVPRILGWIAVPLESDQPGGGNACDTLLRQRLGLRHGPATGLELTALPYDNDLPPAEARASTGGSGSDAATGDAMGTGTDSELVLSFVWSCIPRTVLRCYVDDPQGVSDRLERVGRAIESQPAVYGHQKRLTLLRAAALPPSSFDDQICSARSRALLPLEIAAGPSHISKNPLDPRFSSARLPPRPAASSSAPLPSRGEVCELDSEASSEAAWEISLQPAPTRSFGRLQPSSPALHSQATHQQATHSPKRALPTSLREQAAEQEKVEGFEIDVASGPHCVALGEGLKGGEVGKELYFEVELRNCQNEPVLARSSDGVMEPDLDRLEVRAVYIGRRNEGANELGSQEGRRNNRVNPLPHLQLRSDIRTEGVSCVTSITEVQIRDVEVANFRPKVSRVRASCFGVTFALVDVGEHLLHVKVNGLPICASPFRCHIVSAPPSAENCVVLELLSGKTPEAHLSSNFVNLVLACSQNMNNCYPRFFANPALQSVMDDFLDFADPKTNSVTLICKDKAGNELDPIGWPLTLTLGSRAKIVQKPPNIVQRAFEKPVAKPVDKESLSNAEFTAGSFLMSVCARQVFFRLPVGGEDLEKAVAVGSRGANLASVSVNARICDANFSGCPSQLAIGNSAKMVEWYRRSRPYLRVLWHSRPRDPSNPLTAIVRRAAESETGFFFAAISEEKAGQLCGAIEAGLAGSGGDSSGPVPLTQDLVRACTTAWLAIRKAADGAQQSSSFLPSHLIDPVTENQSVSPDVPGLWSQGVNDGGQSLDLIRSLTRGPQLRRMAELRARWVAKAATLHRLRSVGAGKIPQTLEHVEKSVAQMIEAKAARLVTLLDEANSTKVRTVGKLIMLHDEIVKELVKLQRANMVPMVAGQLMLFLEDLKLKRLEAALTWREKRLVSREELLKKLLLSLKRVWGNFAESVIQFPPISTTPEDCAGLADLVPHKSEKDREKLVQEIIKKREAANQMTKILDQEWPCNDFRTLLRPLPVASAEAVSEKIEESCRMFLSEHTTVESRGEVIIPRGVQTAAEHDRIVTHSPVGSLCLKRKLRARRSALELDTDTFPGVRRNHAVVIAAAKQATLGAYAPLDLSALAALLRSTPRLRRLLDDLFAHYASPAKMLNDEVRVGVHRRNFSRFLSDLQLPSLFAHPAASREVERLFDKHAATALGADLGATRNVNIPAAGKEAFLGLLSDLAYFVITALIIWTDKAAVKSIQDASKDVKEVTIQLPQNLTRRSAFFAFVQKFIAKNIALVLNTMTPLRKPRRSYRGHIPYKQDANIEDAEQRERSGVEKGETEKAGDHPDEAKDDDDDATTETGEITVNQKEDEIVIQHPSFQKLIKAFHAGDNGAGD